MGYLAGQCPGRTPDRELKSHNEGGEHDYENMLRASRQCQQTCETPVLEVRDDSDPDCRGIHSGPLPRMPDTVPSRTVPDYNGRRPSGSPTHIHAGNAYTCNPPADGRSGPVRIRPVLPQFRPARPGTVRPW